MTRCVAGLEAPVRRSRGQAPLPLDLPFDAPAALAVGGDLKNTFCLAEGRLAWMSGHIGDMDDLATLAAFERAEATSSGSPAYGRPPGRRPSSRATARGVGPGPRGPRP